MNFATILSARPLRLMVAAMVGAIAISGIGVAIIGASFPSSSVNLTTDAIVGRLAVAQSDSTGRALADPQADSSIRQASGGFSTGVPDADLVADSGQADGDVVAAAQPADVLASIEANSLASIVASDSATQASPSLPAASSSSGSESVGASESTEPSTGPASSASPAISRTPTTQAPISRRTPNAQAPAVQGTPNTQPPTTQAPSTQAPTTQAPSTQAPTTQAPSTQAPSTQAPTLPPVLAGLPAPIGIPGGPVQFGFNVDLWGQDKTDFWNEIESVPGNGRLIAHEFKSFTKSINTSLYRSHLEQGRDLLLTWNGTDAQSILNGSHDDWIREHARELKSLPDTVMLRFWHEPDVQHKLEWIDHDPQQFIDSWNYVRAIFVEERALNVEWVWCPTAWNWEERGSRFYPGDANVDWLCADGYSGWDLNAPLPPISQAFEAFQSWANQRPNKPILIGEFGAGRRGPGERADWVEDIPSWVSASPNIRAVIYFEADRRDNGEPYDWRLRVEPDAYQAIKNVLSSAPFGR